MKEKHTHDGCACIKSDVKKYEHTIAEIKKVCHRPNNGDAIQIQLGHSRKVRDILEIIEEAENKSIGA